MKTTRRWFLGLVISGAMAVGAALNTTGAVLRPIADRVFKRKPNPPFTRSSWGPPYPRGVNSSLRTRHLTTNPGKGFTVKGFIKSVNNNWEA
jgi:hypothetical protein